MRVHKLRWTGFKLPLRAGFSTSRGTFAYREGLVLRLTADAGVVGLGEATPVPERGGGSLSETLAILDEVGPALIGKSLNEVGAFLEGLGRDVPAALSCAIDVAACDALARSQGVSVARLLSEHVRASVPVNAIIGAETVAEAASQAAAARESGFRCLKLKVGAAPSMDEERRRVAAVRAALAPDVSLRIDANGAWSVEQAVRAVRELEEYGLEMVEQPLAAGDLQGMARVRAMVNVPIAADEDVTAVEVARQVLEAGAADVLVVKPMVVGGLQPARRIVEMALAAGASIVVTTTIDAGIGTAAALHLAATLPPGGPACGLATGPLLAADLIARPLLTRGGRMELPDGPGLGVELDERALAHYSCFQQEVT